MKAPETKSDAVLEAVFSKASKLQQDDPRRSPLAKRFRNAAVFSIALSVGAAILAVSIWEATALAFPSSNAFPTAIIGFASILCLGNLYLFRWLLKQSESSFTSRVWEMTTGFLERPPGSEADVEASAFLNDVLESIWSFVNPDVFKGLINVMEAIIQDNCPPFISAVSIEDMGQGARPIRLVGVRCLPKQPPGDEDGPTSGEAFDDIVAARPGLKSRDTGLSMDSKYGATQELKEKLKMLRERTSVHMEVAFDYGCSERDQDSDKRIHILLVFRLVGGIRVPVWVNMQKIVGCLRARVQLTPDPPFVSTAVVSLMGKPHVDFACLPLFRSSLNVMGMPLVSDLVRKALDAALAAYTSPRSISIDVRAILMGDSNAQAIYPLGVMLLRLHRVYDVESQWADDELSSFFSVGWAKTGDPLYIFRTISDCATPRWEEEMSYAVGPDEVNAQESLKLDFVRVGSLDSENCIGSLVLPLTELLSTPECNGKIQSRTDYMLDPNEQRPVAKLDWSIGFFPKATVSLEQLQRQTMYPAVNSHEDFERRVAEHVRFKFREAPDYADEEYEREKNASLREAELAIMNSQAPDERYLSGLLHVGLSSMNFLSASRASRETEDSDEIIYDDETPDAPTSYANIYINQHRVTRTLTKPRDSDPAYGSEFCRFIRDWRTAEVIIVVRDKRRSRSDTFLGAVRINIAELFKRHESSRVQMTVPIEGGEGSGLANIVILFRSVELDLRPAFRSWAYGTLQVNLPIADEEGTLSDLKHGHIIISTSLDEHKLHPNQSHIPVPLPLIKELPLRLTWSSKHKTDSSFSLPIKDKYSERVFLAWMSKLPWKLDRIAAYSFFKIEDLVEFEVTKLRLPVYDLDEKMKRLEDMESRLWPEEHLGVKPIGHVVFEVKFLRGLTSEHAKAMKSKDVEDVMDVEEALGPNPMLSATN